MKTKAFKAALPYTIPICVGFLFLGISYGFLMRSKGFPFIYPILMSFFIFAGSMEFVTVNLLLSAFNPLYAFFLTLMVNARHLFYGVSMLDKYKNVGWKKWYLIYGMCDESFTINCTVTPAPDVDKGWFMFFVTMLNQIYWVFGATLGALLEYVIHFNTTGIEFVMTALFVVMFINQWEESDNHRSALVVIGCSLLCLIIFGSGNFILPAMALIICCFLLERKRRPYNDNDTTYCHDSGGCAGNDDNKICTIFHFPRGKNAAGLYHIFRNGPALCCHWAAGGVLFERRCLYFLSRTA